MRLPGRATRENAAPAIGSGPALATEGRNAMTTLAEAGTAGRTSLAAAKGDAESARADGTGIRAQEEDEPEGDRLNERVEQLLLDIETGKVKTKVYTLEEHMRYLDSIRED